jgi:ATP-binding cassette subfamily C (CFTR/MRP) protein 1
MDSDRIIVLDKGEIAEFDTVDALLSDKESIFYGMAKNAGLINSTLGDIQEEISSDTKF